jgi:hypothetical protein
MVDPARMAHRWSRAQLLALALLLTAVAPVHAVPPKSNVLSNGSVTPTSGTTATAFVFTVDYSGEAASVTASVANRTVAMTLISGQVTDGRFRGSASLPAGSWPVTFHADAERGKDPSLSGPRLTVASLATPRPTPQPTPTPVPTPPSLSATPLAPTPATSASSGASHVGDPSASGFLGGFLVTPAPSSAGALPGLAGPRIADELWTLLMGGLIAISVLAFVAMVAILRNRERTGRLPGEWVGFIQDPGWEGNEGNAGNEGNEVDEVDEVDGRPIETVAFRPSEPDE